MTEGEIVLRLTDPMNIWDKTQLKMDVDYSDNKIKPVAYFRQIKKRIKWSKQRITRGYADCDCWNVDDYLRILIPSMLENLRENRCGAPIINRKGLSIEEWEQTLDKMIFLWREADENTCTRKNPYEEEYRKALREFQDKYGWFGEGLETEAERERNKGIGHTAHFMSELPEYREIDKNYSDEDIKIKEYRRQSQDEAFDMLKRYFVHLWL